MPNNIQLRAGFVEALDEVYASESLTAVLDSNPAIAQMGAGVNEIRIPKLEMSGLGNYSRNSGYTKGDVKLTYETVKFNYDRGRKFEIDSMDNEESGNVAFGRLAGEFVRVHVAPEGDAFTLATLAGAEGVSMKEGALADGAAVMAAITEGVKTMNDDRVPKRDRYLFITPGCKLEIDNLDTTKSREVLKGFAGVIEVPQDMMYTAIKLLDGESDGETAGGYEMAEGGAEINFMIVHKPAVLKFNKQTASSIIVPDNNPDSDGYIQKYRKYGLVDVYENKVAGIYVHHKPAA